MIKKNIISNKKSFYKKRCLNKKKSNRKVGVIKGTNKISREKLRGGSNNNIEGKEFSDIITISDLPEIEEKTVTIWTPTIDGKRKMNIDTKNKDVYFVKININNKSGMYNGYVENNEKTKYVMISLPKNIGIFRDDLNKDLIRICGLYKSGGAVALASNNRGNIKYTETGMEIYEQIVNKSPNTKLCFLPKTKSKQWDHTNNNGYNNIGPWSNHYTVETSHPVQLWLNEGYFICDVTGVSNYYMYLKNDILDTTNTDFQSDREVIGFITYIKGKESTVEDYFPPFIKGKESKVEN